MKRGVSFEVSVMVMPMSLRINLEGCRTDLVHGHSLSQLLEQKYF
jgi:hypothetical protein